MMEEPTQRGLAVRSSHGVPPSHITGVVPIVAPVLSCIPQFALVHFQRLEWCPPAWNVSSHLSGPFRLWVTTSYLTRLPHLIMRLGEIKGISPSRRRSRIALKREWVVFSCSSRKKKRTKKCHACPWTLMTSVTGQPCAQVQLLPGQQ